MPKLVELSGKKFGRWTVLKREGTKKYGYCQFPTWLCKCDCGNERVVTGAQLRSGKSLSCGCLNDEIIKNQGHNENELVGSRFGRLVVQSKVFKPGRTGTLWLCKCDCGSEKVIRVMLLKKGITTSCGCLSRELTSQIKRTHGFSSHPSYGTWRSMIVRCTDSTSKEYKNYGGRGISICDRWQDVNNFIADMGARPSKQHSLDRIDVNGNYEPENCKWSTAPEQMKNRRKISSTGTVGVSYIKPRKKYSAYISIDGKQVSLGVFEDINDAISARKAAEIKYDYYM